MSILKNVIQSCGGDLLKVQDFINETSLKKTILRAEFGEALIVCGEYGYINIAKWLLKTKPSLKDSNFIDKSFCTACYYGFINFSEFLYNIKNNISHKNCNTFGYSLTYYSDKKKKVYDSISDETIEDHVNIIKWLFCINPEFGFFILEKKFMLMCHFKALKFAKRFYKLNPERLLSFMASLNGYGTYKFETCKSPEDLDFAKWMFKISPSININDMRSVCRSGNFEFINWSLLHLPKQSLNYFYNDMFIEFCKKDNVLLAKWLLELELNKNFITNINNAFMEACKSKSLNIAKWLLNLELENTLTIDNYNKIFCDVCHSSSLEVAEWLLSIKPEIDISLSDELPFRNACKSDNINIIKWLIIKKPTINIYANDNEALHNICYNKNFEFIKFLIEKIRTFDISFYNEKIFRCCASANNLEFAKFLLKFKPNINISINNDEAFRTVCNNNYIEFAKWLVTLNPNYSIKINNGNIFFEIKKLPINFNKQIFINEIILCSMCFNDFSTIGTNCGHHFCYNCISFQYDKNCVCPICKSLLKNSFLIKKIEK
jgi:hypothetical protein